MPQRGETSLTIQKQISAKKNIYENKIKPGLDNKSFFAVEVVAPFAQTSTSPSDPVLGLQLPLQ